ncbi:uncharacterized protein Dwil_GK28093 [Drosophila willistoni]|uniref:Uncharacterized protein n=1 Tax=Drosophila willistoni TaxID=7260 RepID=A0A0Q9X060_DROWI|nr:uncharacterized protein Dwil_GK28093 [Drosophila willistoni]
MNESQIAKINSICFFEIFKQIKKNCEIAKSQGKLDIIKYADLIRFVLTFEWIRYALQNLSYIRDLSILDLNMRMSAEELVECCKSNPNLTSLYIRNTEFYGRLSDITLDGNILYNLVYLQFHMKPGIDAVEYAPLAKLPKLKELIICGEHEIGTLRHLFLGLAAKSRLQKLSFFCSEFMTKYLTICLNVRGGRATSAANWLKAK